MRLGSRWRQAPLAGLALALFVLGCASAKPAPPYSSQPVAFPPPLEPATVILPGDEIGTDFFYHPDLNRTALVRPDGYISLPYAGEILAAGKTPADLSAEIERAYVDVLKQPNVTVVVQSLATRKVYVGGEVATPQALLLVPGMSISHAIFAVGGFRETGHRENVLLLRYRPSDRPIVMAVDMRAVFEGEELDPLLQPYDVVYVPKTTISEVNKFVDQHINQIIPRSVTFLFSTFFNHSVEDLD